MPAQKKSASSVLGAAIGTLGFSALAGVLVTVMAAPAIAVTGMTANNSISLFESLPSYITLGQQKQANEIYLKDASGNPVKIATIFDQNRQEIPLSSMSKWFKDAAIAGEDRRFYEHGGVDLQSVARAAVGRAGGDSAGGASTISMQTVRNIKVQQIYNDKTKSPEQKQKLLNEEYSDDLGRKVQEMRLAISLEKKYGKDTILQGYLNIANFGRNTYGVQAASQQYFSVNAADVTPAQAASIMAIVQNPSTRSLLTPDNYKANQERRDIILRDMYEQKYLTKAEYDQNVAIPVDANFLKPNPPQNGCRLADPNYRLFCDFMVNSVQDTPSLGSTPSERKANFAIGGYKLYGTLDMAADAAAREALQRYAPPTETRFQLGAAASTVEPGTGNILVMAQNKDFDDGQDPSNIDPALTAINYNADIAHGGARGFQPGSTYKPFTLLNYLEQGNGLRQTFNASVLSIPFSKYRDSCIPEGGGTFTFKNDENESGPYDIIRATARSVNSIFAQMATKVDQCRTAEIAKSLGVYQAYDLKKELAQRPSCVIGGCENNLTPLMLAGAYAAIADHGVFCKPRAIDSVVGPDGAQLPGQPKDCTQAIDSKVADAASYAMQAVFTGGGTAAVGGSNPGDGVPYLGKTGTTDSSLHTWTVGASTAASTAVWVGNIVGTQALRKISVGGVNAAQLRHRIFRPIARAVDASHRGGDLAKADSSYLTGKPTVVPDVTGKTPADAQPIIEDADLTFADGGTVPSSAPAGTIVSTDPAARSSVAKGTTVTVFSSDGQGVTVPDVSSGKNLSFNDAQSQLQSAGFTGIQQKCVENGLPTDPANNKVVAQDPAGGVVTNKSQQVTLTVQKFHC